MTKSTAAAFFICGTPSDKRGFEYVELGPESLPENPPSYLDRRLNTRKHVSYDIEIVAVGQSQAAVYCQSYPINPNDSVINRGAFLAVGFVCTATPSLHTATHWFSHVSEIATHLRAQLKPDNTLPKGFRLKEFGHGSLHLDVLTDQCSPLLKADLLLQATHRTGRFEHQDAFTFTDLDFPAESTTSDDLRYTGDDAFAIGVLTKERERLAELAATAVDAAALAVNEQKSWLAFQNGTRRELEGFADRKADFDAVLERLQEQFAAAKRIAVHERASPAGKKPQRSKQPSQTAKQPQLRQASTPNRSKPQQNPARVVHNDPARVLHNGLARWSSNGSLAHKIHERSAFITIIVIGVVLLSTLVYFRNRPPATTEATTNPVITQQQPPAIEVKPTFDDPRSPSDIVRERAALDGPSLSVASDPVPED